MYMIGLNIELNYLALQSLHVRHYPTVYKLTHLSGQNAIPVLRNENDVELAMPNYMRYFLKSTHLFLLS